MAYIYKKNNGLVCNYVNTCNIHTIVNNILSDIRKIQLDIKIRSTSTCILRGN